jgi:hypothetical protein
LAGDFHVHTVYSHDSWGGPDDPGTGPDEFYTLGWTPGQQGAIAESRDLDFIAITDHDNVDGYLAREGAATGVGLYESGWGLTDQLPGGDPLIWVPDYEANAGGGGHAQMHGATHVYPKAPAPEMAAALRAEGGAFQINHPADTNWHEYTGDADGDGRQDFDEFAFNFPGFAPDSLEVWNIGAWAYEPPFPATNDHEFPVQMYDQLLDKGHHIAATGGSDNHWRSTTAAQGVGQPTTWVCAEERTAASIVQALRANRTMISNQPPAYQGPRVLLYADGNGDDQLEAITGDTVPPGSTVVANVENGDGATLRFITNGGTILHEETIDAFNVSVDVDVPDDSTWVRAELLYPDGRDARRELQPLCDMSNEIFGTDPEARNTYCENRLAMLSMTSPIYFAEPQTDPTPTPTPSETFDPATALTYTGPATVRVNKTATFTAALVDSAGEPLSGESVTFTFRNEVLSATTDANGTATVQTKVGNPRGTETLHIHYAGSDTYDPAHLEQTITVTNGKG